MDESPPTQLPSLELDASNGRGLGIISTNMFEPSRWRPSRPVHKEQYLKFVDLILARIQANESNATEARLFFELLSTDGEPGFWAPVSGFMPELEAGVMNASITHNEPHLLLVGFLRLETRNRRRLGRDRSETSGVPAQTGLPKSEQEALAATIFGRGTSSTTRTDRQNQFLQSYTEMGYPAHLMAQDQAYAAYYGRTIQRDSLGLPMHVGTESASMSPPRSQNANDRSGNQSGKVRSSESEHISTPMTLTREPTPEGQKPPLRLHACTGWAQHVIEKKQQRQPRLHPGFEPEVSRNPIVIRGFDPAVYAAAQRQPDAEDTEDIGQKLKEMDLRSPGDLAPVLQASAGNVAPSSSEEPAAVVENIPSEESKSNQEVSGAQVEPSHELPPIPQPSNLLREIPDPSSAEIDRAFLEHVPSSDDTLKFNSQLAHPSFLASQVQDDDSVGSTLPPQESLLSQLLEGAVPDVPESRETTRPDENGRETTGLPATSGSRRRPRRSDSAIPPDFFRNSQEIILGNDPPQLEDEEKEPGSPHLRGGDKEPNLNLMDINWYDRLP